MEKHNNNWGKMLRDIGLIIGIPLLLIVIFWMFTAGSQSGSEL